MFLFLFLMIVCDVKLYVRSRMAIISLRQGVTVISLYLWSCSRMDGGSVSIPRDTLGWSVIVEFRDHTHLKFV